MSTRSWRRLVALARAAMRRLRRLVATGRRLSRELAPPQRTIFGWLRRGSRGDIALGGRRFGLDVQPPERVAVGDGVVIGDYVDIHLGPRGRLEIGDDVVLGNHVKIAADDLVRIAAGARLGDYGVVTDTWTYGRDPGEVPTLPPAPVEIGSGVVLETRAIVGPGVRLPAGHRVEIGGLVMADLHDTAGGSVA